MTHDPSANRHDPAAAQAAAIWLRATDGVLCGLNHELTNRLYALDLFSASVVPGEPIDTFLHTTVVTEVKRMETLLKRYRLMERSDRAPAEPVQVADVLPDAVGLLKHHLSLRDVEVTVDAQESTPPVLAAPASLTKALLLLCCAAARHTRRGMEPGTMTVRHGGDADFAEIVVETTHESDGSEGEPEELEAVRWLLRDAAVQTAWTRPEAGRVRATLRLGSLMYLRKLSRPA